VHHEGRGDSQISSVGDPLNLPSPDVACQPSGLLFPGLVNRRTSLERDELWLDQHPALAFCWSMNPPGQARGHAFRKTGFHPSGQSPRASFSGSCSSDIRPTCSLRLPAARVRFSIIRPTAIVGADVNVAPVTPLWFGRLSVAMPGINDHVGRSPPTGVTRQQTSNGPVPNSQVIQRMILATILAS
jgi:hypothetical protein